MAIDPGNLPHMTVVETRAEHFARDQVHLTTARDVYQRGDLTILRVFVPVPDGVSVGDATRALAALHPDRIAEAAIEDAVPEGEWDGRGALANLRAAGFDVVRVTA